ncbi:Pnap_2097 family protein [Rhizobium sp. RU36D]|uniref:Pnap_2097 family protein n=1 Tax=Rhizobium sp. RU36D TaxID=1907415 RepID=UPI0009D89105|nr:Pnap_2097 family protein [Rhizobium sp. RU36D]SMC71048.1 probable biosynthetic protein, Pnap_2097 family [Rhizobium sp. RU36D]
MNIAVADIETAPPSPRQLMEQALAPHLLLGMPHLTPSGLSETWLMKELGHRHWLMLALELGMDNADFRTPEGDEAYAAICATSLESQGLSDIRANDVLSIRSDLVAVSRTRFESRHRLYCGSRCVGRAALLSTFVSRHGNGNRSIARTMVAGSPSLRSVQPSLLIDLSAALKAGCFDRFSGLEAPANPPPAMTFTPSASQEFNGAGLFYFAEFQALADRAFEHWQGNVAEPLATSSRHVSFAGNIEPGEPVSVALVRRSADGLSTADHLLGSDGRLLAVIVTNRLGCRSPHVRKG